jgi:Ca-activated chloride channel family protein
MNETETSPVNLVDLIGQLAEPAQPPAVSMVPQTVGWVVLAVIVLFLLTWLVWRGVRSWQTNAYRRIALAELQLAGDDPAAIAAILRRTALAAWPRTQVASLVGDDWLAFLDRSGGEDEFSSAMGQAMLKAPYRPGRTGPVAGLKKSAGCWIRRHRVDAAEKS